MQPARQSSVFATAISFVVGFLFGFAIRDFFANLNRHRDTKTTDDLAQQLLGPIYCDMEGTKSEHRVHQEDRVEEEPDGLGRALIHKTPSGDDIFFDAICDSVDSDNTAVSGVEIGTASGTSKQLLYAQIDELDESSSADLQTIFERLKEQQATLSEDANYWWRLAKAAHLLSKTDTYLTDEKKADKKTLMNQAAEYAQQSLKLDTGNGDCHKWCAITIGALNHKSSFSVEKIKKAASFKKHLDLALSLKSNDATLCHVEGRFYAKILKLSSYQRFFARRFMQNIPSDVTHDKVLQCFLDAYRLKPQWKENLLHLGKTLVSMQRPLEAAKYLEQGLELPVFNQHERIVHSKLKELLDKCPNLNNFN